MVNEIYVFFFLLYLNVKFDWFLLPDGFSGPLSPGSRPISSPNMSALLSGHGGVDSNLAKWFGADLLKQQVPMPPIPIQGQKVLTVDEIERR